MERIERKVTCPTCRGYGGGSDAAGMSPLAPGVWFGQGDWVRCPTCGGKGVRVRVASTERRNGFLGRFRVFDRMLVTYKESAGPVVQHSYNVTLQDAMQNPRPLVVTP